MNFSSRASHLLPEQILNDAAVRKTLATQSHYWFFHVYFAHYVKYATADFQREMFALTESPKERLAVIVAFRGSAKSTIMTLSFPIWAILGRQQKKFVVLISQTQQQAKLHLTNLRRELEANDLLRMDLGPFEEQDEEWSSGSIVLPKYNARITALSVEQSIRGQRHGSYRPDLIICDDVEDLASVKTREGRDKTHQWLVGDVIPSGDVSTRIFVVGNLLHEDSLMMRLKEDIETGKLDGAFKSYPLLRDGRILWPGKYPAEEHIAALQKTIGNETAWQREYLLRIVSDAGRVVHPEWLHYYDELPALSAIRHAATGIDLAISERETADCTAMVTAYICGYSDRLRVFILANPINERLTFPQTEQRIMALREMHGGITSLVYIEDVGYQRALIQSLNGKHVQAEGVSVLGQDKRSRLMLTTSMIQNGIVCFPRRGAEPLIQQLIGFGIEKHDDLADAFSLLILKVMSERHCEPRITWI